MSRKRVEILAPAGSYESMTAAVNAGADAVYIGGSRFGARAYANNLDEETMLRAIDYVHLHGCSLYMTVNTLMKEEEMGSLYSYLNPYYMQGLDAAIVQDFGVFSYLREHFPGLHLHASTQMTITGVCGARLLKEMGASRVVTARELSLEEIRQIHDQVDVEIESFVHGALCYCYSGQCLMSSLIGGRSGNRGRCAQPCRLPYEVRQGAGPLNKKDERYVLSLKDLCTLDLIPDMVEAGVYSMKIEGRMKSPRYTAGVVSVYRKYVDRYLERGREGYAVDPADRRLLLDLFDRGGFSDGYYREHNGRHMVALREKPAFREGNQALFDRLDREYVNAEKQEKVEAEAWLTEGEPARLSLALVRGDGGRAASVCVEGAAAQAALNQPVTEEKLRKQLGKTGGTPFVLDRLDVHVGGRPFLPVQDLNELRRRGFHALEEEILAPFRRGEGLEPADLHQGAGTPGRERGPAKGTMPGGESGAGETFAPQLTALAERPDVARALAGAPQISRLYLDACLTGAEEWGELAEACRENGKECFLALPQIFRGEARSYFLRQRDRFLAAGFDGCLLRSAEEILFLREEMGWDGRMVFDASLYTFNREAAKTMEELGADELTLPVELNEKELAAAGCAGKELIVYGRLPVMVSAQCVRRTVSGCDRKPGLLWLKDRMGKEFPVRNCCRFCCNTIYNADPLSLLGMEKQVRRLGPARLRLQFTVEEPETALKAAEAFGESFLSGREASIPGSFTRGHFKRGVE